ncbi:MAG: glycosyltransferase, partial [Patescibacteria group bacterium]
MSEKPIILVATGLFPPDIGGPATYSKILLEELPNRGFEVQILSFGVVRHYPKVIRHLSYLIRVWRQLATVERIYALDPVSVGWPVLLACFFRRRSYWLRVAGDYAWEQGAQRFGVETQLDEFSVSSQGYAWPVQILKKVQTLVAKRAERIIVPSHYLKKIVSNWGIAPEKITVIYNAFENEISQNESLSLIVDKKPILFSVGRLVPWKGFSTLITLMP